MTGLKDYFKERKEYYESIKPKRREYKFRGISISSGKMIYGMLNYRPDGQPLILQRYEAPELIISGTEAQYTDHIDIDGKEIYEDDFIILPNRRKEARGMCGYDIYLQVYFQDVYMLKPINYPFIDLDWLHYLEKYNTLRVVGNIHENPEIFDLPQQEYN